MRRFPVLLMVFSRSWSVPRPPKDALNREDMVMLSRPTTCKAAMCQGDVVSTDK